MEKIDSFFGLYRFLSNFYPSEVEYEGEVYSTIEHAYQAAKTNDQEERKAIREASSPGLAKRYGRVCTLREDWEEVKIDVMKSLVRQKFTNEELRDALLETEEAELIEGNTWGDRFWGVCKGEGQNNLGKILMEVRQDIRTHLAHCNQGEYEGSCKYAEEDCPCLS